jgi:hypothetical protein
MDVLLEVETDRLAFPDKQRLREIASEISLASGIIPSLLVVDRQTMQERGDFSLFDDIRDEGSPCERKRGPGNCSRCSGAASKTVARAIAGSL